MHKDFNQTLLSIIQQNIYNALPLDTDEPLGVLQAYQGAVPAQIVNEAKSCFPEIEEVLSKTSARQFRSRQDVNALRGEADIYLTLRKIATGGNKFRWDRVFFESVIRCLSALLAISSSHGLFKMNAAVNELQVTLGSGI